MITLTTEAEAEAFLTAPGPRWLLKHSNACPISFAALEQVEAHLAAGSLPAALVVIQDSRPLSNWLSVRLARVHQSPQLFLLNGGSVTWAATHWSITAEAMTKAKAG